MSRGPQLKSLNIKNPEAHRLAAAISKATGESMTRVVTEALRDRFEHLQSRRRKASVEELMAIARRVSSKIKGPPPDHGALLYGDDGLPK